MKKSELVKLIENTVRKQLNEVRKHQVKRGQHIKVDNYYDGKIYDVITLNNSFVNEYGDEEVGIKFANGNKGYALISDEEEIWSLGEGDYGTRI